MSTRVAVITSKPNATRKVLINGMKYVIIIIMNIKMNSKKMSLAQVEGREKQRIPKMEHNYYWNRNE